MLKTLNAFLNYAYVFCYFEAYFSKLVKIFVPWWNLQTMRPCKEKQSGSSDIIL